MTLDKIVEDVLAERGLGEQTIPLYIGSFEEYLRSCGKPLKNYEKRHIYLDCICSTKIFKKIEGSDLKNIVTGLNQMIDNANLLVNIAPLAFVDYKVSVIPNVRLKTLRGSQTVLRVEGSYVVPKGTKTVFDDIAVEMKKRGDTELKMSFPYKKT